MRSLRGGMHGMYSFWTALDHDYDRIAIRIRIRIRIRRELGLAGRISAAAN